MAKKKKVTFQDRRYKIPIGVMRKYPQGLPVWVLKKLIDSKNWPKGPKSRGGRPRVRNPREFGRSRQTAPARVYNINLPADQIIKIAKELALMMPQVREEALLDKTKKLIEKDEKEISKLKDVLEDLKDAAGEHKNEKEGKRGERRRSHEGPIPLEDEPEPYVIHRSAMHPRVGFIRQDPVPASVEHIDQLLHDAHQAIRAAEEENRDTERVLREDDQRGRGLDGETSNLYLDKIGKKLWPNDFLGVVARDDITKLPFKKMHDNSFIFNTDPAGQGGTHWVACYVSMADQSIELFDSFGRLAGQDIIDELEYIAKRISPQYHLKLKQNRIDFQRENSNRCGYFALSFLWKRHKGESFRQATKWDSILNSEHKTKAFQHMLKNKFPEI